MDYPGSGDSLDGLRKPGDPLEKSEPKRKRSEGGMVGKGQQKKSAWPGEKDSLPCGHYKK